MADDLSALAEQTTARLRLAPLRLADAEALRRLTDDPAITGAISFLATPFTLDDARALIEGGARDRMLGAWERTSGRLIGVVGVHLHNDDEIEIGYWIGTGFAGAGYASEAAGAIVRHLARAFPGRRIVAECRPENRASWRVLEKIGFRPSGEEGLRPGRKRLRLEASPS